MSQVLNIISNVFLPKIEFTQTCSDKLKTEFRTTAARGERCEWFHHCKFVHSVNNLLPKVVDRRSYKKVKCCNHDTLGCAYHERCLYLHDEKQYVLSDSITVYHSKEEHIYRIVCGHPDSQILYVFTVPVYYLGEDAKARQVVTAIYAHMKSNKQSEIETYNLSVSPGFNYHSPRQHNLVL